VADPKPTHTYVGNPGYEFPIGGQLVVLHPGDEVILSGEEAARFGDDFTTKGKAPAKSDDLPSGDDKGA
jgi:hypothetical protein